MARFESRIPLLKPVLQLLSYVLGVIARMLTEPPKICPVCNRKFAHDDQDGPQEGYRDPLMNKLCLDCNVMRMDDGIRESVHD